MTTILAVDALIGINLMSVLLLHTKFILNNSCKEFKMKIQDNNHSSRSPFPIRMSVLFLHTPFFPDLRFIDILRLSRIIHTQTFS